MLTFLKLFTLIIFTLKPLSGLHSLDIYFKNSSDYTNQAKTQWQCLFIENRHKTAYFK